MCYIYYVFNFFLIDSGKGKLCACLCQDGGMHKKACDKFTRIDSFEHNCDFA